MKKLTLIKRKATYSLAEYKALIKFPAHNGVREMPNPIRLGEMIAKERLHLKKKDFTVTLSVTVKFSKSFGIQDVSLSQLTSADIIAPRLLLWRPYMILK